MTTLSELLRLQEEATPGPWRYDEFEQEIRSGEPDTLICGYLTDDNAAFIAAARNFDFASLQTQYEAMREWLTNAKHHGYCSWNEYTPDQVRRGEAKCDCGLSALRASLDTKARGDE